MRRGVIERAARCCGATPFCCSVLLTRLRVAEKGVNQMALHENMHSTNCLENPWRMLLDI